MQVYKEFTFDSAHWLPNVPPDHKCRNMHGHTYRLRVYVQGPVDNDMGWVIDFADVKRAVEPLVEMLDHRCLNDIEGMENPTAENIARWFRDRLRDPLPGLARIEVSENATSGCILVVGEEGGE